MVSRENAVINEGDRCEKYIVDEDKEKFLLCGANGELAILGRLPEEALMLQGDTAAQRKS